MGGECTMSGHSKWAGIKHKKAVVDAKRGKVFSKLIKEITVAARLGGGDVGSNPRLRTAVQAAKAANMPQENVQRAIKKGTGELPGVSYEEARYEGYGSGGVAVLVDILTDNKNRTTSDVRHIFTKAGGNLGDPGCVAWMFEKKGLITIDESAADEDEILALALEAGAEDVEREGDVYEITTAPADFEQVKEAVSAKGYATGLAEINMIPKTTVKLEGKQAQQILKLVELLEDHEDVQHVYANYDVPDEAFAEVNK